MIFNNRNITSATMKNCNHFQAPNRLNNFRSLFNEKGITITPRVAVSETWFVTFEPHNL